MTFSSTISPSRTKPCPQGPFQPAHLFICSHCHIQRILLSFKVEISEISYPWDYLTTLHVSLMYLPTFSYTSFCNLYFSSASKYALKNKSSTKGCFFFFCPPFIYVLHLRRKMSTHHHGKTRSLILQMLKQIMS